MTGPEAHPSNDPDDVIVVKDADYYREIREAMGRGSRSLFFGTSAKALDNAVRTLQSVREPTNSDVTNEVRTTISPEAPSSRPTPAVTVRSEPRPMRSAALSIGTYALLLLALLLVGVVVFAIIVAIKTSSVAPIGVVAGVIVAIGTIVAGVVSAVRYIFVRGFASGQNELRRIEVEIKGLSDKLTSISESDSGNSSDQHH